MSFVKLHITPSDVLALFKRANDAGAGHHLVQLPNPKGDVTLPRAVLQWQPDLKMPGNAELRLVLHADGRWEACYTMPGTEEG